MDSQNLVISKLEGYSGIRLKNEAPLVFKPGINLLVGRNGCGKSNLLQLIQLIVTNRGDLKGRLESSFIITHCRRCLDRQDGGIEDRFGEVPIVEHHFKGHTGYVKASLKNVHDEYLLKNLMRDGSSLHQHVEIICKSIPAKQQLIYGSEDRAKIEMSGYIGNFGLFSKEHDNRIHSMMEGPIQVVSQFMKKKLVELYEGEEFTSRVKELENSINEKLDRFLETANKKIKINLGDIGNSGRISLSLMDNDNYIQSSEISSGEAILLNLIFSLTSAKVEGWDILSFDEPDIHMHDDMIQVLVNDLSELSKAVPDCIIIVASHSTALIERIAGLGRDRVNIITFDNERKVSNSETDVDLINALERNGVHFSPLMLSRRKNIFIENKFKDEKNHKNFFLKFFSFENLPNIVPIGNSGNVQDSESFIGVFEDIMRIPDVNAVGIQDGDIWFKRHLVDYLKGEMQLEKFVELLQSEEGVYILPDKRRPNQHFFNCWEIENLYLMDELLRCWKLRDGIVLTKEKYRSFLRQNQLIISQEYFGAFFKALVRIRIESKKSITETSALINAKLKAVNDLIKDTKLENRMRLLVDSILRSDLVRWVPGKEIKVCLEKEGYSFDDRNFDFDGSELVKRVREILV